MAARWIGRRSLGRGPSSVAGQATYALVDGYAMGSLSMDCYTLGCHDLDSEGQGLPPPLPQVPPDETNT